MRIDNHAKSHMTLMITLCFFIIFGATSAALAGPVPHRVEKAIQQEFPGAVITESRRETFKGQSVTEVEFTTREGAKYEAIVSPKGEIISVEEEKGLPVIGGDLSLGVALRVEKDVYRGVDTEYQPVPFFRYDHDRLSIVAYDAVDVNYRVFKTDCFAIGLLGSLNLHKGYDPDDSDYLKGMDELSTLYGVGLGAEWNTAGLFVSLDFMQDISSEHEGQEVELALSYPFTAAGFIIRPELSVTWMSDKAVDYFYGVSKSEARAGRPVYSPGSSYEVEAGLMVRRPIFGNFSIIGLIQFTMYGNAITDSPITEKDYSIEGAIGVAYAF